MFFRPRPKPPLAQVGALVDAALVIIEAYWRDESYHPSPSDLQLLASLRARLFRAYSWMGRLEIRLERRSQGAPEIQGGWKW